jgi:putative oxidoreductase
MNTYKVRSIIQLIIRIIVAFILIQTLFFKFTAAPESVYIFSAIGAEPWGRIASGIMELLAAIFILIPATVWLGALIGLGVISGAIITHLTVLGIVVLDDGGLLFMLALAVFLGCLYLTYQNREHIINLRYNKNN